MKSESTSYGGNSAETMLKIIIFPMSIIGLNPLEKRNFFKNTIRVYICNLILGYGMYSTLLFSYYSVGDFYAFVVPVAYFVCLLLVFTNVMWLDSRRDQIRHLLNEISQNIFEYTDEWYFRDIYRGWLSTKNYSKLRYLVLLLEISGFIFAGTSPLIGYIFVGQMRTFIYPGWISWKVDTPLRYVGTYCLQAAVAGTVFWVYYVTQIYISFILVEFLRQFKKLDTAIISLHDRTSKSVQQFGNQSDWEYDNLIKTIPNGKSAGIRKAAYDKIYQRNLIMCIKHHQKLLKLFRIFRSWYVLFYSLELAISVLSFSLLFYCLVEANDYERYSSIIGVTALLVSNLFTRCYVGERFAELNDNLSRSIFYCTKWDEQIRENRKLILLFHLLTTRPLTLSGFGLFSASYCTFTAITRISYSYFNLIRASI